MGLEALLAIAAFVAGAALERHRQASRPHPLTLRETPAAWRRQLQQSVGVPRALAAALVLVAAAGLLALPSAIPLDGSADRDARVGSAAASAGALPRVRVLRRAVGRPFEAPGARFLVHRAERRRWARGLRTRRPRPGRRWIAVQVEVRNLSRRPLDPHGLSYRLRARDATPYEPIIAGGTGPRSLTQGGLRRGELGVARLVFEFPRRARAPMLVFEPVPNGPRQVAVAIGES